MKVEELVDVPEQEYSLFLENYNAEGKSYGADTPEDADFRYQTGQNNVPKSQFFGKVKTPEKTYVSGFFRAMARMPIEATTGVVSGTFRAMSEAVVKPALNLYDYAGWELLDNELDKYKESIGFNNMSVRDKKEFMELDPTYLSIKERMNKKSQEIAQRESPDFKKQTDELWGNYKKAIKRFEEGLGVGEKETDSKFINNFGSGASSLLEAAAIVAITKNPGAAGVVFGVQQGSGLYEEAREKGVDVPTALSISTAGGYVEGLLERWGLHKIAENITTKTLGKALLKSFVTESTQEASQQTAEELLMYKIRNDETLKDKAYRVFESWIIGGLLGSVGSFAARPFVLNYAKQVQNDLVQNGVDEKYANELVNEAINGTPTQKEEATHDIQVALGEAQFKQFGLSQEEARTLAENMALTSQEYKDGVVAALNAELDPETYEGGTPESGARFFDKNLQDDVLAEDFDIAEQVKETALDGGMDEQQANLVATAVDSFAKVIYNKTGITPKENWETGALHVMITDERQRSGRGKEEPVPEEEKPKIEELQDISESEIKTTEPTQEELVEMELEAEKDRIARGLEQGKHLDEKGRIVYDDDGSYVGDDGHIYDKDGTLLFQSPRTEDKDLYVTHNKSLAGVREALKLGGLAMPSLAMRKVSQGNINQFGDIVFVGNESLAKPSRTTEVYDRDAWTPSLGGIVRYDLGAETNTLIRNILKKVGQENRASTFRYNIEEEITRPQDNNMAMELYALDKGLSEEESYPSVLYNNQDYLDWYEENISSKVEPYLWTENDSNTDMIRRKFTLNNMIKVLKKQEKSGGGFIGDYIFDVYKLLNFHSQKFKNLKEIKKNREKLVSREEQFESQKKLNDEFLALAEDLKKDGQEYDFGDATYGVGLALLQKTDKDMAYWLDYKKLQSDESAINKIKDFVKKMKEIPTDYFEVKPRRAVEFNEFSGVIIPKGKLYDEVANKLEQYYSMNVERVDKGNEEQYKQALQNIQKKSPTVFFQDEQQKPRGFYKHSLNEKILAILKNGDASTVIHELGHFFTINYLEALQQAGQEEEARAILDWLGVDSISQLMENTQQARDALEKLARAFETYIMTKEAPSSRLKEFFERFKGWLLDIYHSLKPEQINDDVKEFFDKMLTSDEVDTASVMRLAEKRQDVREVIKQALAGKSVEIGGINIDDVKTLIKTINSRIPKKVPTLFDRLVDVGINEKFAKEFDLHHALSVADFMQDEETLKKLKKKKLITQKQINLTKKLMRKTGGISREDELIDFLSSLGLMINNSQSYEDTSALWDNAMELMSMARETYAYPDLRKQEEREAVVEAIDKASSILQGLDYKSVLDAVRTLAKEGSVGVKKETLKYIKEKQKQIDSDYKKLLKQMIKAQKEDMQNIRDSVVDYIKEQPILAEDKVKLMGFIKKANSMNTLQKIAEQIRNKAMEYYDKEQRKELNKAIQKELKQTKPLSGGEQRYDYENNKLFKELREYNKLTRERAGEELAKLPLDEETAADLTETDLIKRRFLSYKAGGADASTGLLNQVLQDIVGAKEKGKQAKTEEEHEKMVNMENDRQELIKILDESKANPKDVGQIIQNKYRTWITSLYSMLNSIFGKGIADKYQFEVKQTDVNAKIWEKTTEVIGGAAKILGVKGRTGVIDSFSEMARNKQNIVDMEGLNHEVDTFKIIDIYNAIKNEKTRKDYYRAFGEEQINSLVNTLTVNEKALGDYLMQEANTYYDKLNAVNIKLYGIDLPKVDNYWPATSEHKDSIDIQGDYSQQSSIPSALKERVKGSVIPRPSNAWEKFNKHIAQAEYISGLGLDYMNIKKIFKSRRIKNKLIEKYGDKVYRTIMDDIESLSLRKKTEEIDAMSGFFQKFFNNMVLAKIAIGVPVFAKQLTSVTNYSIDMPVKLWVKDFAAGLSHPKETVKYMMDNVPYLKARLASGHNEALQRVINDASKMSSKKVVWTEALSSFTRYGDIGAIIFGGYPYMKYLKNTGVENAVEKFEFSTLRSQQSGTPVSLSPYQRSRGMMQMFQAFNNTPTQYMRMIYDSVYMYKNGDMSAKQTAKQLFNFGIIQPILYILAGKYALKMMFLDKDDDDDNTISQVLKQILLNPIDGIPIFSDFIGAVFDRLHGDKNFGMKPVFISDLDKSFSKLNKKDLSGWDIAEIITPIVEGMTSAPMARFERMLKKYIKD